jgi:4-diphosphocytidyl-2-C-methyl-D-erythritol kinase
VEVRKSGRTQLNILGPKAAELPRQDDNLILKAAALFPRLCQTDIRLHKTMPVASGIGGGSADAAAALHAMAALWDLPLPDVAAQVLLGADMGRSPVLMQGIGAQISHLGDVPALFACLVNPGRGLSTARVFEQLASKSNPPLEPPPPAAREFCAWLKRQRNDLQAPALAAEPMIADVLEALAAQAPLLARMSGSGATCFALFESLAAAQDCAAAIQAKQRDWWVASGALLI